MFVCNPTISRDPLSFRNEKLDEEMTLGVFALYFCDTTKDNM